MRKPLLWPCSPAPTQTTEPRPIAERQWVAFRNDAGLETDMPVYVYSESVVDDAYLTDENELEAELAEYGHSVFDGEDN